jgi:predicted dehydrogenase
MAASSIRIGIVGAGENTRRRHIPGFRNIPGVELAGVVNSTPQSTARAAEKHGIARQFQSWQELVASPDIDAILIGTWPNLHCEVTLAALESGKHVLTEARLARNLDEARRMQAAAERHANLVAQVVPSPFGLVSGPEVARILADGFIGELRELIVIGADDSYWDYSAELHWRQQSEKSGRNVLALGIMHETALRWTPQPTQVFAQQQLFEPERPIPAEARLARADIPDSLQVLTQLPGGGRGIYHISGVTLFGPGKQIHLYGSRGAIKVNFLPNGEERILLGHAGDDRLKPVEIPEDLRGGWRVEADFVGAIRGEHPIGLNDFATGVRYMEFVEAVALSAERNAPVTLPLSA